MKNIEQKISSLVKQQFPDFYKEEGDQFVAFVTSYFEWLEEDGNTISESRNLTKYRDIDETLDEFIIHFKEKYLKNIQFDTATNKVLLVKNALDLYRSKGTERSIDLFFKLVYGTNADVYYPADNILRASDGVWERPEYLEIGYSKHNIDYVGKQIVGGQSKATAFVERYIRRKTIQGYVNLLYVSNIEGRFKNNEVLGVIKDDAPLFDIQKMSKLIGSIDNVTIQTKGKDFKVGDIVNLVSSGRGDGGLARVSEIGEGTGIVDFLLLDGGYGYTTDAESIVSEKVIDLTDLKSPEEKNNYFDIMETIYSPVVNVSTSSATSLIKEGDILSRYDNDVETGTFTVIDKGTTDLTLNVNSGSISNGESLFTSGNLVSVNINSIEDRTVQGSIMGRSKIINIDVVSSENIIVGDTVYQYSTDKIIASGVISSKSDSSIVIEDFTGSFKDSVDIQDSNQNTLASIAKINYQVGVYDIKETVSTISYDAANNDSILSSNSIYKYSSNGSVIAEAKIVTSNYDSNTGSITILPLSGYFIDSDVFYTDSNTSMSRVVSTSNKVEGGDFNASSFASIISVKNRSLATISSLSFGSGANFEVATIGETEDIFIGTDIISSNNVSSVDLSKEVLSITSNTGFTSGDVVYQEINRIAFNPNTSIDATTGFITLPSANTRYLASDIVKYSVDVGNTAISGMVPEDFYRVASSNSTGIVLSYVYRNDKNLNRINFDDFAIDSISETGHYISKLAYGTVE